MSGIRIDNSFDSSLDPLGNNPVKEKDTLIKSNFLGRKVTLNPEDSEKNGLIQKISKSQLMKLESPKSILNKFELLDENDFEIYPMEMEQSKEPDLANEIIASRSKEKILDFLVGSEKSFEIPKERKEMEESGTSRNSMDNSISYLRFFISSNKESTTSLMSRSKKMYQELRLLQEEGTEKLPESLKEEMRSLNKEIDRSLGIKGLKRTLDAPIQTSPKDYSHGEISENLKEKIKNKEVELGDKWRIVEGSWLGIEPKFVATKKVTKKDLEKIDQPFHPYQEKVVGFLQKQIRPQDLTEFNEAVDKNKIFDFIQKKDLTNKVEGFLSEEVTKFKKKHFIKLDYQDPKNLRNPKVRWESINNPGSEYHTIALQYLTNKKVELNQIKSAGGMLAFLNLPSNKKLLQEVKNKIIGDLWQVEVPIERARRKFGIKASLYVKSKRQSPRDVNFGAVKESIANEIYTFFDIDGQKLKIIPAQYSNGYPKLLLDSTEIRGPEGQKYSDLLLKTKLNNKQVSFNQVQGGRIQENQLRNPEDPQVKHAIKPGLLGSMKAIFLFMGDRDKIGSKGENLGYYIGKDGFAHLMNIDPGKAMPDQTKSNETDLMKFDNIFSDFSFKNPTNTLKDRIQGGYKNFSIFDDTEYAEKMEGITRIIDPTNWAKINAIFDRYIQEYGDENPESELNFRTEIEEMRTRLESRRRDFIDKFKDRSYLLENNQVTENSKDRLNLLDNLEKFSAGPKETFSSYKSNKEGEISLLQYVQVKPGKRIEWVVEKPNVKAPGQFIYTLKKPSREVANRLTQLMKQDSEIQQFIKEGLIRIKKNGEVSLTINEQTQKKLTEFFSNRNIAKALGHKIR